MDVRAKFPRTRFQIRLGCQCFGEQRVELKVSVVMLHANAILLAFLHLVRAEYIGMVVQGVCALIRERGATDGGR